MSKFQDLVPINRGTWCCCSSKIKFILEELRIGVWADTGFEYVTVGKETGCNLRPGTLWLGSRGGDE